MKSIKECEKEIEKKKYALSKEDVFNNIILKSSDLKNLVSGARVLINLISYKN